MVMIGMTIEEAKQKWTPIKRADLLEKLILCQSLLIKTVLSVQMNN